MNFFFDNLTLKRLILFLMVIAIIKSVDYINFHNSMIFSTSSSPYNKKNICRPNKSKKKR